MKRHRLLSHSLLIICMLLGSISLYATGNPEMNFSPSGNTLDLSQADTLQNPSNYTNNQIQVQNLPGYVGRIDYTGQNTTLTFNQSLSGNTSMFYFTHTSLPNAWSEYFLVGRASGRKNNNEVVILGQQNTVITKDGDTIVIGVSSGTGFFTNYEYTSTWVDLAVVRRNQAHLDTIPNGNYQSYFTVKSNRITQALPITLYGNRYVEDPVTAWLSITPDQVAINLSQALGNNKVEVVQAQMNLEGDDYNNNYGVSIIFRDNAVPESDEFKFRHTVLGNSATIPFSLHRGTNASQTQMISPKAPSTWDNLSFTTANVWKLFVTGVLSSDVQQSLAGSYTTTISVEITPLDSNVQVQ